jgi:C4-dicarboxylate-specific signal transduction histidine kinase
MDESVNILSGIDRIANIVESMREVSQTSNEGKELTDIYKTILTSLTIGYNRSKQIVEIFINGEKFDLNTKKSDFVFKSEVQNQRIEQVWIIIINNALDELIKIDDYEKRSFNIEVYKEDKWIVCKFKDNAGGIKEELLDRLFEPFVSTKQSGGMGVGLNIAHRIVEDQDGKIEAYNEDGGAVFLCKVEKCR